MLHNEYTFILLILVLFIYGFRSYIVAKKHT